jgi:hypothetical protein
MFFQVTPLAVNIYSNKFSSAGFPLGAILRKQNEMGKGRKQRKPRKIMGGEALSYKG